MADSRKIYVLAILVVLLGLTSIASAQVAPVTCTANGAVPPTLRSEGATELVGDIVLVCSGGTPAVAGTNVGQVNVVVYLGVPVTSRTYDTSGTSEVLLLIDDPNTVGNTNNFIVCGSVTNGCTFPGVGGTGTVYGTQTSAVAGTTTTYSSKPNTYRGIISGNTVQFIGVPIDAPGSGSRVIRITNLRGNVSGVQSAAGGLPGQIQAYVSITGAQSIAVSNPSMIVGYVQNGLAFTLRTRSSLTSSPNTSTDIAFAQCSSLSRTTTTNSFILQYTENFPTAFKVRGLGTNSPGANPSSSQDIPGSFVYNTESGLYRVGSTIGSVPTPASGLSAYNPSIAAAAASTGLADSGTRLKAVFNNIPAGVSVYVSNVNISPVAGISAVLVNAEGGQFVTTVPASFTDQLCNTSSLCTVPTGATLGQIQLPITNNSATAVWEVLAANAYASENIYFMVWFSYTASPANNSPAPGTSTVTAGYAPTPTGLGISASSSGAPTVSNLMTYAIPRFKEPSLSPVNVFAAYLCRTNILFPYVTNASPFDTGIAIANTSQDAPAFATTPQNGACTIYSFGTNAPASFSTGTVNAGTVTAILASTQLPNFTGYVIAQCTFQFAHGFAFISDFGARNLAMGYLGLIIPDQGLGGRSAGAPNGEALNN